MLDQLESQLERKNQILQAYKTSHILLPLMLYFYMVNYQLHQHFLAKVTHREEFHAFSSCRELFKSLSQQWLSCSSSNKLLNCFRAAILKNSQRIYIPTLKIAGPQVSLQVRDETFNILQFSVARNLHKAGGRERREIRSTEKYISSYCTGGGLG